jgi:hypothetical protein
MALPTATTALVEEDANWAVERATSLPEVWALVAENGVGLVDAWRLMSVCTASREGVKMFLSTGLVVCGGLSSGGVVSDVWRLDLATLRWEPMPALVIASQDHACCAVRGTLVVLGGITPEEDVLISSEVEMLSSGAFVDLPPLSRGGICSAAAIEVDESDSAAGEVLLLGGRDANTIYSTVHLVDLATGACARQPDHSSTRALIMRRLGCRMAASIAREVSVVLMMIFRRRRYGVRLGRGRRMQHGTGGSSPR